MFRFISIAALAAAVLLTTFCGRASAAGKVPRKAVSTLVRPAVKTDDLENKHFITKWLVLGNFTFGEDDFGGDPQTEANNKEFMPNEGALDGTQKAPKNTKWEEKSYDDPTPGRIDLGMNVDHAAAYCVAWLYVPETITDAKLLVGSDDYIKVWIDGKLVHSYNTERRSALADQDTVKGVTLKKGYNRIVVKCVNVVYGWEFYLRFTDKDGKAFAVKQK